MSSSLASLAQEEYHHGIPVYRYDVAGAITTLACSLTIAPFSSDVKRKSQLSDRKGVSVDSSSLEAGEVLLVRGDVVDILGAQYIVGELNSNLLENTNTEVEFVFELVYCNARIDLSRIAITRDTDTQVITRTPSVTYTNIPCGITTEQLDFFKRLHEVRDEYSISLPEVLDVRVNDIVELQTFPDTDNKFQRSYYQLAYNISDFTGFKRFRLVAARRV